MFKSGTFLNIYINTLNLPLDVKRELMDSNPKTISDVSLWLENNAKTEPKRTGFPPLKSIKNTELFNPGEEPVQFMRYSDGGHLVDTDETSWGLAVEKTGQSAEVENCSYYSEQKTNTSNKADSTAQTKAEYIKEQQDKTIDFIRENADQALDCIKKQKDSQGKISKHYNSVKEYFNSEMAYSNVCRVLFAEYTTADILEKAQSGELTVKEYWELKINQAVEMLTACKNLSNEDKEILKRRLSFYSPEELNGLIDKIKSCNNAEYEKLTANVDRMIQEQKNNPNSIPENRNSINAKSLNSPLNGKEIMTFEKAYFAERGVEFKTENIENYEKASSEYAMAAVLSAKSEKLHTMLDENISTVKNNERNGIGNETIRQQCIGKLETSLLNTLMELYGNDEKKINQELEELSDGALSYKDGKINSNSGKGGAYAYDLTNTAEKLLAKTDTNLKKLLDGKPIDEFKNKMAKEYEKAYGRKNAEQLATAYKNDQEAIIGKVRTGVELTGGAIMVAGMFFCPIAAYAGAIVSTAGGIAVEAYNESSRKDGMSQETKEKLIKELATNAALFAVGAGAGKVGSATKAALLAQKCPTLAACVGDIGVDATISLLGDLALTGQIDIQGEGLSQLLSLLAGHVAKVKASKSKKISTEPAVKQKPNEAPKTKNSDTNNKIIKEKVPETPETKPVKNVSKTDTAKISAEIETKLKCSKELANEIADIIASKPELKDKLSSLLNSAQFAGKNGNEIKEIMSMATKENIDTLIELTKNKSLGVRKTDSGELVNDYKAILESIEKYPKHKDALLDIAKNTQRPASDIEQIAQYLEKYPQHAQDICDITKLNHNVKVGYKLNGYQSTNIDSIIALMDQNPDIAREIKDYISVQRKANNDTTSPINDLVNYVKIIRQNPDKINKYKQLASNPNLDSSSIYLLSRAKLTDQQWNDIVFLSNKHLSEQGINTYRSLLRSYPELRETLMSAPPKYDLIDKDIKNTSQQTLQQRQRIKNNLQSLAPEQLKTLEKTLGKDFFDKVRWEDIIPANATPQEITKILSDLNDKSKFFSRIATNEESYGKNIQWAHEMDIISKTAEHLISKGKSFDETMKVISSMYSCYDVSKTLESNIKPDPRRKYSGCERCYDPDGPNALAAGYGAMTPFNKDGGYNEYYDRFMNIIDKPRVSPYDDVTLTKIINDPKEGPIMAHPLNSSVDATMAHARQRYDELKPLISKAQSGQKLTPQEISVANEKIAEIYFLSANAMPYYRGSNGISDIFLRGLYKELGIELPALKQGVSLDLEAFCMDLDTYKQKWKTFFE